MKLITPVVALGAGVGLFVFAAFSDMLELAFFSFLAIGIGVGTLFPALKDRWSSKELPGESRKRIEELETRLRLAEDDLVSATQELKTLREQREFDLKLQSGMPAN